MQRRRGGVFAVVFRGLGRRLAGMSLNRCEQRVFDYLEKHRDERQFWLEKVRALAKKTPDPHAAVAQLAAELWRYHEERSAVVAAFREETRLEGGQRISMKNLAELLLRQWAPPRPKKRPPADGPAGA